jgi:4-hydroxy-tetrahydrodipicolinate reductase
MSKKIRVGVVGSQGRMGAEITLLLIKDKRFVPALAVVKKGKDDAYLKSVTKLTPELSKQIDVLIDFSLPENFEAVLSFAEKTGTPIVSGTTGITPQQKKQLATTGRKAAVLWSPNMSLGISILRAAMQALSDAKGFDFQVEEFHHNQKKDNPGGTALALHDHLNAITGKKNPPPIGIRGGGIYGVHKIYAMAQEEVLCFEHQVLSRTVFARGAVEAAFWLSGKDPGLYHMQDLVLA